MKDVLCKFWIVFFPFLGFVNNTLGQYNCDTTNNYANEYILNANDYPYTTGNGIVISTTFNVFSMYTTMYNATCGGTAPITFSPPPSYWMNTPNDSIEFTFSVPVSHFVLAITGTNSGEAFTVTANAGTPTYADYCTVDFTSTANTLTCIATTLFPGGAGTMVSVQNTSGATIYTIKHNGTGNGSLVSLLDCFDTGCVFPSVIAYETICDGDVYNVGGGSYTAPGYYIDSIIRDGLCDSIVFLYLSVNPSYAITIDTTIYEGDSITIGNIQYDTAGTYVQNLQTILNCDSILTINLNVVFKEIDSNVVNICEGESYILEDSIIYQNTGIYYDTLKYSWGHRIHITNLTVYPYPKTDIKIESTTTDPVCISSEILLSAIGSGATKYQWFYVNSSSTTPFGENSEKTVAYLHQEYNRIRLKASNDGNCETIDEINIIAKFCCETFVPNAFTPNNDGLNDLFVIHLKAPPLEYNLKIFNRVGQIVFETSDPTAYWDGNYNGKPAAQDAYSYLISGKCANGEELNEKGNVTLLR